jgi:hypothetical protein
MPNLPMLNVPMTNSTTNTARMTDVPTARVPATREPADTDADLPALRDQFVHAFAPGALDETHSSIRNDIIITVR